MANKLVLLDVCDVIVDLHRTTIELANLKLDLGNIDDWDIFNLIADDERSRVEALYNDPEFWRSLPAVRGSLEGVEALRSRGYDIHFITSPWHSCENWEGVRRAWLADHFRWFGPLDMTSTAHKHRFRGDILIDDRPKHVKQWQEAHPAGQAWIFDSPFNKHLSWPLRGTWGPDGITAVHGSPKKG